MTNVWPSGSLNIPRVTSEFNPVRVNPVTRKVTPHNGIDLIGFDQIKSPVSGVVTFAGYNGTAGIEVRIREDGTGDVIRLLHNRALNVRKGQRVAQGEVVAWMGSTGQSTGPHCHYETKPRGGAAVNPRAWHGQRNNTIPAGGGAQPTPAPPAAHKEDDDMPHFGSGNRIYWPNGFYNVYHQSVWNALKWYFEKGVEQPGTEGTVEREVWVANEWMLQREVQANAAAAARATVEALKASGIPVEVDLSPADLAGLGEAVAADILSGLPTPPDSFSVTVNPRT